MEKHVYINYLHLHETDKYTGYNDKSPLLPHKRYVWLCIEVALLLWSSGVIMANHGPSWRDHRRFALMTLRNFGLGKQSMEDRILGEVEHVAAELEKSNGKDRACFLAGTLGYVQHRVFISGLDSGISEGIY